METAAKGFRGPSIPGQLCCLCMVIYTPPWQGWVGHLISICCAWDNNGGLLPRAGTWPRCSCPPRLSQLAGLLAAWQAGRHGTRRVADVRHTLSRRHCHCCRRCCCCHRCCCHSGPSRGGVAAPPHLGPHSLPPACRAAASALLLLLLLLWRRAAEDGSARRAGTQSAWEGGCCLRQSRRLGGHPPAHPPAWRLPRTKQEARDVLLPGCCLR